MSVQFGISMADYLSLDGLSSGVARETIAKSPFHAKYLKYGRDMWSKPATAGTIAHQLLLEGNEDGIVLVDAADWRTNAAKEARNAALADGKNPILIHQIEDIRRMVNAARVAIDQSELAGIFGSGQPEVTVDWEDNGIVCKARPDYLTKDWHISVKTTEASAEPVSWVRRQMNPNGYDFGLAFYKRGLEKNDIRVEHRLLVIEQNPPFGVSILALTASKWAIADALVDEAIKTWAKCLETATFPGYANKTHWAEATPWELAEAEERELTLMVGA